LAANSAESPASFGWSESRQRIELRRSISNRGVTVISLRRSLSDLALVAEAYEDAWSKIAVRQKPPRAESPAAAEATDQTDADASGEAKAAEDSQPDLVGRWSASLGGGEAFAIELHSDAAFQLVHAKADKTTSSKGTFKRSGNRLTLTDTEGTKLEGTVRQESADAFDFSITSGDGNVLRTIRFKKAA
jgi:hypothetical protein